MNGNWEKPTSTGNVQPSSQTEPRGFTEIGMSHSFNQAPPEGCFADYSEDCHDLLGVVESRRHPNTKMNCAACEPLGRGVDVVLGVAQLPFDQVLVTFLTRTGGTMTAPATVPPEKPSVFTYVYCPPDAPLVQTNPHFFGGY
jgi:hypothetical protein